MDGDAHIVLESGAYVGVVDKYVYMYIGFTCKCMYMYVTQQMGLERGPHVHRPHTHIRVHAHVCTHRRCARGARERQSLVCACVCVCVPACTRNVAECAPRDVCVLPCQVEGSRFVRQTYAAVWVGYEAEGSRLELQRSVIKGLLFQVSVCRCSRVCVLLHTCLRVCAHVCVCVLCTDA